MDAGKKRIWIRGQFIEVTDEVYAAYMKGDRKMRYFENDLKTERFVLGKEGQVVQIIPSREDSLDRLMDENAKGKGVCLITGVALDDAELTKLAAELKKKCGCGGAVKDLSLIHIFGDRRSFW